MSELFPPTGTDAAGIPVVDVPAGQWLEAALHARDTLGMDFVDWLSAVDVPDADPPGVDIVLHVLDSSSAGRTPPGARAGLRRLLLRTRVPDPDPRLVSLTSVWPGTAWHERETFEMFGVTFDGFDDGSGHWLRPLLLPDGFEGTPLRKSFVLAARASKAWPGAKEPGESDSHAAPGRRKTLPPGVPDPGTWGPRAPGDPTPVPEQVPDRPRSSAARRVRDGERDRDGTADA
jgi:NADH-quinone oxidoreductase subunit C